MPIGAMNHPARDSLEEIDWVAEIKRLARERERVGGP
jgi:hypothetical protein